MKRTSIVFLVLFLLLSPFFFLPSPALTWQYGTQTPNLGLALPSTNAGIFQVLGNDLMALDGMFGETTSVYASSMTVWSSATTQDVTLAGNPTISFTGSPIPGQPYRLWIIQPSAGGPNGVTWGSTITWGGGSAPTLTTVAGKKNLISCYYINSALGWNCEMNSNVF